MRATDTIVALSTPPGRSGLGVVRLSGPLALPIARRLVRDDDFSPSPNQATLKSIHDPETSEVLDRVLLTYFKGPRSFTGDDVVEFSCHGSPVILRRLIDIALSLDARIASPGEFSLRALSNGRMDLSRAEAVRDLINAQTSAAAAQAMRQLRGELSMRLQPLKETLVGIVVRLESSLEFVEDDLPEIALDDLRHKLAALIGSVEQLASTFRAGRLLKDGIRVTLAGRPNVGKSSVFNVLLGSERAIVTEIPGTTRDSLSESINVRGVPVLLTDTAGIRESSDRIEAIGVERSRQAIADADLVVVVFDGSEGIGPEDEDVLAGLDGVPRVFAVNKSDLDSFRSLDPGWLEPSASIVEISARTGEGLDELCGAMVAPFMSAEATDSGILITDARHFDLLQRTRDALVSASRLLEERTSEELVLVPVYDGLRFLGQITGETTTEEILSEIFSTFCIGK